MEFRNDFLLRLCLRFRLFWEPDTQNWQSSATRVTVNNFVRTPKCIKITNMNTSFSCFIRARINVDLL